MSSFSESQTEDPSTSAFMQQSKIEMDTQLIEMDTQFNDDQNVEDLPIMEQLSILRMQNEELLSKNKQLSQEAAHNKRMTDLKTKALLNSQKSLENRQRKEEEKTREVEAMKEQFAQQTETMKKEREDCKKEIDKAKKLVEKARDEKRNLERTIDTLRIENRKMTKEGSSYSSLNPNSSPSSHCLPTSTSATASGGPSGLTNSRRVGSRPGSLTGSNGSRPGSQKTSPTAMTSVDYSNLKSKHDSLVQGLQEEITWRTAELNKKEVELDRYQKENQSLQRENSTLQREAENLQRENRSLMDGTDQESEKQMKGMYITIENLEQEIQKKDRVLRETQETVQDLEEQMTLKLQEGLKESESRFNEDLERLEKEMENREVKHAEDMDEILALNNVEIRKLRNEKEDLEDRFQHEKTEWNREKYSLLQVIQEYKSNPGLGGGGGLGSANGVANEQVSSFVSDASGMGGGSTIGEMTIGGGPSNNNSANKNFNGKPLRPSYVNDEHVNDELVEELEDKLELMEKQYERLSNERKAEREGNSLYLHEKEIEMSENMENRVLELEKQISDAWEKKMKKTILDLSQWVTYWKNLAHRKETENKALDESLEDFRQREKAFLGGLQERIVLGVLENPYISGIGMPGGCGSQQSATLLKPMPGSTMSATIQENLDESLEENLEEEDNVERDLEGEERDGNRHIYPGQQGETFHSNQDTISPADLQNLNYYTDGDRYGTNGTNVNSDPYNRTQKRTPYNTTNKETPYISNSTMKVTRYDDLQQQEEDSRCVDGYVDDGLMYYQDQDGFHDYEMDDERGPGIAASEQQKISQPIRLPASHAFDLQVLQSARDTSVSPKRNQRDNFGSPKQTHLTEHPNTYVSQPTEWFDPTGNKTFDKTFDSVVKPHHLNTLDDSMLDANGKPIKTFHNASFIPMEDSFFNGSEIHGGSVPLRPGSSIPRSSVPRGAPENFGNIPNSADRKSVASPGQQTSSRGVQQEMQKLQEELNSVTEEGNSNGVSGGSNGNAIGVSQAGASIPPIGRTPQQNLLKFQPVNFLKPNPISLKPGSQNLTMQSADSGDSKNNGGSIVPIISQKPPPPVVGTIPPLTYSERTGGSKQNSKQTMGSASSPVDDRQCLRHAPNGPNAVRNGPRNDEAARGSLGAKSFGSNGELGASMIPDEISASDADVHLMVDVTSHSSKDSSNPTNNGNVRLGSVGLGSVPPSLPMQNQPPKRLEVKASNTLDPGTFAFDMANERYVENGIKTGANAGESGLPGYNDESAMLIHVASKTSSQFEGSKQSGGSKPSTGTVATTATESGRHQSGNGQMIRQLSPVQTVSPMQQSGVLSLAAQNQAQRINQKLDERLRVGLVTAGTKQTSKQNSKSSDPDKTTSKNSTNSSNATVSNGMRPHPSSGENSKFLIHNSVIRQTSTPEQQQVLKITPTQQKKPGSTHTSVVPVGKVGGAFSPRLDLPKIPAGLVPRGPSLVSPKLSPRALSPKFADESFQPKKVMSIVKGLIKNGPSQPVLSTFTTTTRTVNTSSNPNMNSNVPSNANVYGSSNLNVTMGSNQATSNHAVSGQVIKNPSGSQLPISVVPTQNLHGTSIGTESNATLNPGESRQVSEEVPMSQNEVQYEQNEMQKAQRLRTQSGLRQEDNNIPSMGTVPTLPPGYMEQRLQNILSQNTEATLPPGERYYTGEEQYHISPEEIAHWDQPSELSESIDHSSDLKYMEQQIQQQSSQVVVPTQNSVGQVHVMQISPRHLIYTNKEIRVSPQGKSSSLQEEQLQQQQMHQNYAPQQHQPQHAPQAQQQYEQGNKPQYPSQQQMLNPIEKATSPAFAKNFQGNYISTDPRELYAGENRNQPESLGQLMESPSRILKNIRAVNQSLQ